MKRSSRDYDLLLSLPETPLLPLNIDRRSLLMGKAAIGAAAVMTGTVWTPEARAQQATKEAAAPPLGATLSPDLDIVRQSKGPVMTVVEEFYKVGPGPSSSHTIGPMRNPTTSTSAARNCLPTSWRRPRASRGICSTA